MPISVYNSLTRKKEEFTPIKPPKVNIYTCGVTVYDDSHIGHARSLYCFDLIRRYLKYRGFKVNFVRNITDIDDKIINRANELKIDWKELVGKYILNYQEDLLALGIEKADHEPRASANIPEMVEYIKVLLDKAFAYESGGDVYFNVRKFSGYGKLSGQSIDQMQSGARIEPSERKKDPLDFALWKKSKQDEPAWDSPWGKGRPGWHIECSVMSQKFLKTDTIDIHAGGRDLIFPHHENEIAQGEARSGRQFAKYWIHHGLLTINGQKMAKSLGNFISIKDILKKHSADTLKAFFLGAHYASPIDYSEDRMRESAEALERIVILLQKIDLRLKTADQRPKTADLKEIEKIKDQFIEAMDDDFNSPRGLAAIFDLVSLSNKKIEDADFLIHAKAALKEMLDIFGISLKVKTKTSAITDKDIKDKIQAREKARKDKDYALSDKIRKELEAKGVILEDTKDGTTWRRKL
ncbi:cysteine--tRNA ligase [Candidatus Omnitrophota bacterium]